MFQDQPAKTGTIRITLPEQRGGYDQFSIVSEQLLPEQKSPEVSVENKVLDPFIVIDEN